MGKWLGWFGAVVLVAIAASFVSDGFSTPTTLPAPEVLGSELASTTSTTMTTSTTTNGAAAATTRPSGDDPIHIAVLGDVGTGEEEALLTADAVAKEHARDPYDGMLLLGDNVYEDGNPDRLDAVIFEPFAPLLDSGTALWAALGNHDVDDGFGPAQAAALGLPHEWYSVEIGDGLLIVLDSNQPREDAQQAWLEETLASSDHAWRIVAMHHPLFSAGVHGSSERNREAFLPILERYGVDIVFAGHDHDYQRSKPQEGILYIVTGAAAKLRDTGTAYFTEVSSSQYHFVDMLIYPDRIELQAIGRDGVFDSTTVSLS